MEKSKNFSFQMILAWNILVTCTGIRDSIKMLQAPTDHSYQRIAITIAMVSNICPAGTFIRMDVIGYALVPALLMEIASGNALDFIHWGYVAVITTLRHVG